MLEKKLTETEIKSNLKTKNSNIFDAFCKSQVVRDLNMIESHKQLAEITDTWKKSRDRAEAANAHE